MNSSDYTSKFKTLIARERNAEMDFHTNEIKSSSAFSREKKGRCVTQMKKQPQKGESDSIFRFVKTNGNKLQPNEFSIGGNVLVSTSKNPLENHLKGIVVSKNQFHIDIYIQQQSNLLKNDNIRIDVYVNDSTFNAQKKILDELWSWTFEKGILRDILLHNKKPQIGPLEDVRFYDLHLNASQQISVKYALREKEFYMIQGPPGTGKTKTSIEIIRQHLRREKTVLVAADSNMAVDNVMLGLLKANVAVVRIGESPKILPEIQGHTLNRLIEKQFDYKIIEQCTNRIKTLREVQRNEMMPNKQNSAGLSYFQIGKLAQRGQSDFGISLKNMRSMAKWIKAQNEIKQLRTRADSTREKLIKHIIKHAGIICTTNTNSIHRYLEGLVFDLVLIDEAGQSTEPSCLLPISKGKKVVLVGDHKQLPPTILSPEAKDLSVSLFERMMTNSRYVLLDTQYRMNPLINEFPSNEFYDGNLMPAKNTFTNNIPNSPFSKNVVFIDSTGKEEKHKGGSSFFNSFEIEMVFDLAVKLSQAGIDDECIGIISPYGEQVKKLQERLMFVEVNTIDGFQGREKDIIIMSLVRSNHKGSIGFLKDLRRLNVALTRASCQLIVIGNEKTVSNNETYKRFIDFVKEKGEYLTEKDFERKIKE